MADFESAAMPELVVAQERLAELLPSMLDAPAYAVDTEFHRERTYYPRVALVQINWGTGLALIDPLVVSLEPLAELLEGPGLAIMHACSQDLEVLTRACSTLPTRLFDTQLAAGFAGMRSPSLASLHDKLLGIRLPKGDRLTDWLRRPLNPTQLEYAASDVAHLLQIHDLLEADLVSRGRLEWAEAECTTALERGSRERDPVDAWLKIKEARHLSGHGRGIAQALAQWREERAQSTDQPARFVLPDLAIVGIAQHPPATIEDLRKVRGIDDRHLRAGQPDEIIEIASNGAAKPVALPTRPANRALMERLRPAVTLVSAWLAQYAHDIEIDPALLGTRSDIEALLRGDDDARLATGWRQGHVGAPIQSLVDGHKSLAFDDGRLVIEDRPAITRTP